MTTPNDHETFFPLIVILLFTTLDFFQHFSGGGYVFIYALINTRNLKKKVCFAQFKLMHQHKNTLHNKCSTGFVINHFKIFCFVVVKEYPTAQHKKFIEYKSIFSD